MIRFADLTRAYWPLENGEVGPFAFIDTVRDNFVTLAGESLWDDVDDMKDAYRRHLQTQGPPPVALADLLALLPPRFRGPY